MSAGDSTRSAPVAHSDGETPADGETLAAVPDSSEAPAAPSSGPPADVPAATADVPTATAAAVDAPAAPGDPRRRRSGMVLMLLERYGLVLLFVLTFIFFAQFWDYPSTFRSGANIRQVLRSQTIPAILALATVIPLVCGKFDLTTGSVAGMSAMTVAAMVTDKNQNIWVAVAVALGFALVVGLVNGLLVAYVGVNAFVVTLGVSIALNGLVTWYSKGRSILLDTTSGLANLASREWLGVPRLVYVVALAGLAVYYLLQHTPLGRYLHSIGSNATAARLVGLNVPRLVLTSFLLSALLSGVAGVLYLGSTGSAQLQGTGMSLTLPALAAAFLGATAIRPGRFNVAGTLVAVYFIAFTLSGLNLNGVENWVQDFFTGAALAVAVALASLTSRRRAGSAG